MFMNFFLILLGFIIGYIGSINEDDEYKKILKENNLWVLIGFISLWVLYTFILKINLNVFTMYLMMMSGMLFISGLIDQKIQELPDILNAIFLLNTIVVFVLLGVDLKDPLLRSIGFSVLYVILSVFGGLGFGDVKLLFPITMVLFLYQILDFWMYALISAIICILPKIIKCLINHESIKGIKFAFGPYIIIGFLIVMFV